LVLDLLVGSLNRQYILKAKQTVRQLSQLGGLIIGMKVVTLQLYISHEKQQKGGMYRKRKHRIGGFMNKKQVDYCWNVMRHFNRVYTTFVVLNNGIGDVINN
jgi:hypothetical protein